MENPSGRGVRKKLLSHKRREKGGTCGGGEVHEKRGSVRPIKKRRKKDSSFSVGEKREKEKIGRAGI